MNPNRLAWILGGVVLGASLVLWAVPRAKAQSPTPLGEIKREPVQPKTDASPSDPAAKGPAPRIVQGLPQGAKREPGAQITQPRPTPRDGRYIPVQGTVPCWYAYITPDSYTVQCASGFWITYMADGTQVMGNGVVDPSASARGSTVVIDPATGGPSLRGQTVTPPGNMPMEAPHQAPMWGQQPLQTR